MNLNSALRELKRRGTAQNRKVYRRHGVGENMYGVSFADLRLLAKQIKTDHDLAVQLWATGNHDAQILATLIADPAQFDAKTLDAWSKDLEQLRHHRSVCGAGGAHPLLAEESREVAHRAGRMDRPGRVGSDRAVGAA